MDYVADSFGLIQNLKVAGFTLRLKPVEPIVLPEYKGSSFRGVLGWQLKKVICVNQKQTECYECMLSSRCLYNYLFSSQLPINTRILRHTSNIPSPIIIEPPLTKQLTFQPKDTLEVGLVLIGKGMEYLPYIIYVFTEMGRAGIGRTTDKRGGKFELAEVWDDIGREQIYDSYDKTLRSAYQTFGWQEAVEYAKQLKSNLTIEFLTPTRFKEREGAKNKLSLLSDFGQLVSNIFWRLIIVSYFHCNPYGIDDERFVGLQEEITQIKKELAEKAENVELIENDTYWQEYDRWSNRQNKKMKIGGFIGRASFTGSLTPYLPLLYLGEYIHIGKQTMFGLGKYEITY